MKEPKEMYQALEAAAQAYEDGDFLNIIEELMGDLECLSELIIMTENVAHEYAINRKAALLFADRTAVQKCRELSEKVYYISEAVKEHIYSGLSESEAEEGEEDDD